MVDGWIILDKSLGLGSTQGVAAVKRNLRQAGFGKVKVGHGGTLDPLATGVLPIGIGEATKLCGRMLDASKVYAFTVTFGAETDTLDLEGKVVAASETRPSWSAIEAILPLFTGPISQIPPAYSALMVDGERAYDLARKGEDFELKSRDVTIHSLQPSHWDFPNDREVPVADLTLTAHVSKGTYIRSLARDIARALGTVGHVTMLRRLRAGPFDLAQAISLDKLNEVGQGAPLEHVLLPLEAGLVDIPALNLDPEQARAVRQGRVLTGLPFDDGLYWARAGNVPVALVELSGGSLSVTRGFNIADVAE
ncbi:tRNA pseudouridine(55) synthase TruB [Novosphingobium sp. MMS21-SN21R]|uniref:tRNA pseudouridine(55) synthase TruB n=1 Tax=Novosphingobium sp. MMS21-SN21R TaxID=2969298 RepID=UPI0028844DFE|nr:tRNA pseudouridine(55) synthase TruB [Novosphingobium sp. MMS21-SN21R]MDT0508588.1 tRNA pseudouridine(55) synthase TruB [Novosphingobium sp. MMS21-SN21R]